MGHFINAPRLCCALITSALILCGAKVVAPTVTPVTEDNVTSASKAGEAIKKRYLNGKTIPRVEAQFVHDEIALTRAKFVKQAEDKVSTSSAMQSWLETALSEEGDLKP